jgi:hypothetical protein
VRFPEQEDTYAATLAARIFRALLAICAYFNLDITQFDAISAFTNTDIDELVYCLPAPGYERAGKVLKLLKALYGLKRSPLLWHNDLTGTLKKMGFRMIADAPCVWTNEVLIIFFFVDDITIASRPEDRQQADDFGKALSERYPLTPKGEMKWFLGNENRPRSTSAESMDLSRWLH